LLQESTEERSAAAPQCGRPGGRGSREPTGGSTIVNDAHEIVAWTSVAPEVENGRLRHAEAERLLGGAIFCTQVALLRADQIRRAGGPTDWAGPWRCLALCPLEYARALEQPRAALFGDPTEAPCAKPVGQAPA